MTTLARLWSVAGLSVSCRAIEHHNNGTRERLVAPASEARECDPPPGHPSGLCGVR